MRANVGDTIHVPTRVAGGRDAEGEIVEVWGEEGTPPYVVWFGDGREALLSPDPDCRIEPGDERGE
ncbi:DUF1918 domain-containing protein [Marinactinospora thermotolerans]|uniref:DUF1918 domain-containing protein n=1 Tax=Marinactinospora thermotolerans TaxID=531310 RepID=UPI003D8B592C